MSLDDILVTPLKRIPTLGGEVMHALKKSDTGFLNFGEVYFSWADHGVIKAWKCHQRMTMNLMVPFGKVKFVFYLENQNKSFRTEVIGEEKYARLTVPPGIWFGFQGMKSFSSLVVNVADLEHDAGEVLYKSITEISHKWSDTE